MIKSSKILLCTDLDRTIIPNGLQPESPKALPLIVRLAGRQELYLSYVSGRDQRLIKEAIEEFCLPAPDFAIGDVGTVIYRVSNGDWRLDDDWQQEIGHDWKGLGWQELFEIISDFKEIRLQEYEKQSSYKLSFYADRDIDEQLLMERLYHRFGEHQINANIIWSEDEISGFGLLDILPPRANKLEAIKFLVRKGQFDQKRTVFAGDSGNDLDVLTSGLPSILVRNASEKVREKAINIISGKQMRDRLYLARGNFYGMNGNYAAGVLEGLAHFIPEIRAILDEIVGQV
jgi:sucrose-6F-phosphate phosphohydrolase